MSDYSGPYAAELSLAFDIASEAGSMILAASDKKWSSFSNTAEPGKEPGTKKNSVDVCNFCLHTPIHLQNPVCWFLIVLTKTCFGRVTPIFQLVTETDQAVEKLVRKRISKAFPDHKYAQLVETQAKSTFLTSTLPDSLAKNRMLVVNAPN
jgi:hypothetical protein